MIGTIIFILIVSLLIFSHEFGHFLAAKRAGIRVEKFSLGFGPSILKFKRKNTVFLISLIPLGGYVKLAGDNRSEYQGRDDEFLSKPIKTRANVIIWGPIFNYLLAVFVFWIAFIIGYPTMSTKIGAVLKDYPAEVSGIKVGDKIVMVNGEKVENWDELTKAILHTQGPTELIVLRDGQKLKFKVTPRKKKIRNIFGKKIEKNMIGVAAAGETYFVKENIFKAFYSSVKHTLILTMMIFESIFYILIGTMPVKEAVTGPIGIYTITTRAVSFGLSYILVLIGSLGISLFVINLIPLPMLDGGHLLFLGLEKIRKKPLSPRTEEIINSIGLAIIFLLMLSVFYLDITKLNITKFLQGR